MIKYILRMLGFLSPKKEETTTIEVVSPVNVVNHSVPPISEKEEIVNTVPTQPVKKVLKPRITTGGRKSKKAK